MLIFLIGLGRPLDRTDMGLDICDDTHYKYARVGSYSGVQWSRKRLIELTIEYLNIKLQEFKKKSTQEEKTITTDKKNGDMQENCDLEDDCDIEDLEYLIQLLQTWIVPDAGGPIIFTVINYHKIRGNITESMVKWNITGLVHFVNCSDCRGAWSFGQVCDIVQFFDMMIQFAKSKNYKDDYDFMEDLNNVFNYAKINRGYVIRT